MKVAIFAGTPVDTKMGESLLLQNGLDSIPVVMAEDCATQSKLQYFSKNELEELFIKKARNAIESGAEKILIYCNSLSAAIDYKKIEKILQVEFITPLDTYKKLPAYCNNIVIIGANALSAYTIDKIIQENHSDKKTISFGNLSIVELIEKKLPSQEIITQLNLDGFLKYIENIKKKEFKPDSLLLGCTHFPYIKDELKKLTSLNIIEPTEDMLKKLK